MSFFIFFGVPKGRALRYKSSFVPHCGLYSSIPNASGKIHTFLFTTNTRIILLEAKNNNFTNKKSFRIFKISANPLFFSKKENKN